MFENIFHNLGLCFRKENDLSDITWAIADRCQEFKRTFLNAFGFEIEESEPCDIYREVPFEDLSRPDFRIENAGKFFTIENKIFDKNYHFAQYSKEVGGKKPSGLGIITNYQLDLEALAEAKRHGFQTSTWEKFIELLSRKIDEFSAETKPVISAYIAYVKEVCGIMDLAKICFDRLNSIPNLVGMIKKTLMEYQHEEIEINLQASRWAFGNCWAGQYFRVHKKGKKSFLLPFWGIYYEEEIPYIYFAFEKDYCPKLFNEYKGKTIDNEFFGSESDSQEVDFTLKEGKFSEFKEATLEKQMEILKGFLDACVKEITKSL